MIIGKVHHDNLRVPSLTSGSNLFPNEFRSNFSVFGQKVVGKAIFIVTISLPNHSLLPGVSLVVFPVFVVVNVQFSCRVLDKSVSVIDAGSDSQVNRAGPVGFVEGS